MLRQVALDTETTGLSDDGTPGDHRIIEVGCVEIIDRRLTGRQLQLYVNPERPVDEEAFHVHGISDEMLADKPKFAEVADQLIDFIRGSELLIHNAKFDTAFLDKEWQLLNLPERTVDLARVVDTVALAMKYCPGRQVNLDNLCNIYDVDASARTIHGALLDAQLLAEVYLAMTGGQSSLSFEDSTYSGQVRRWHRPEGRVLPKMAVEPERYVVHVAQTIELSQQHQLRAADEAKGQKAVAGSAFGPEFDMEMLVKGEEEGKKDFAKRLSAQFNEKLTSMLDEKQQQLYRDYMAGTQKEYDDWVARVLGTKKVHEEK